MNHMSRCHRFSESGRGAALNKSGLDEENQTMNLVDLQKKKKILKCHYCGKPIDETKPYYQKPLSAFLNRMIGDLMKDLDELQKALDKMVEDSEIKTRLLILKEQFIVGSDTSIDRWMERAYRVAVEDVKEKFAVFRQSLQAKERSLRKLWEDFDIDNYDNDDVIEWYNESKKVFAEDFADDPLEKAQPKKENER